MFQIPRLSIVVALIMGAGFQIGLAQSPSVAPDHSLTTRSYVQKGLPADDREWSGDDYAQAASVLKALAANDSTHLPRYGSAASGGVFARIVSPENLKLVEMETLPVHVRFAAAVSIMKNLNQIIIVYTSASTVSQMFDSELVELFRYTLEISRHMMLLGEKVIALVPTDAPDREVRLKGWEQMRRGVATIVSACFTALIEKKSFKLSDLARLAKTLEGTLPAILPRLPPGTQQELPLRLQRMIEQESDSTLKEALEHIAVALDKSKKVPRMVQN